MYTVSSDGNMQVCMSALLLQWMQHEVVMLTDVLPHSRPCALWSPHHSFRPDGHRFGVSLWWCTIAWLHMTWPLGSFAHVPAPGRMLAQLAVWVYVATQCINCGWLVIQQYGMLVGSYQMWALYYIRFQGFPGSTDPASQQPSTQPTWLRSYQAHPCKV